MILIAVPLTIEIRCVGGIWSHPLALNRLPLTYKMTLSMVSLSTISDSEIAGLERLGAVDVGNAEQHDFELHVRLYFLLSGHGCSPPRLFDAQALFH